MATLKVFNGTTFVTALGKVFDGTAFTQKMKFFDGTAFIDLFPTAIVDLNVTDIKLEAILPDGVGGSYAGVQFESNGEIRRKTGRSGSQVNTVLGLDSSSNDHTDEWFSGTPVGSQWEVACLSIISGAWDGPAANTGVFVGLGIRREWFEVNAQSNGVGTHATKCNFQIREVANTSNFVDFTVECIATNTA